MDSVRQISDDRDFMPDRIGDGVQIHLQDVFCNNFAVRDPICKQFCFKQFNELSIFFHSIYFFNYPCQNSG